MTCMAGRRTDARGRMVVAARQLFREQGYHATALSDVLKLSEAPRGSVYFHFPGGKAELAAEAAGHHVREQLDFIKQATEDATSPADLARAYVDLARQNLVASDYQQGCTLAPLVIESARGTNELDGLGRRGFVAITEALAAGFEALGLEADAARQFANAVLAGTEGALITARALRSPAPFDSVLAVLTA